MVRAKPADRAADVSDDGHRRGADATMPPSSARSRRGSHDALAALYDRHGDAVFAAASRLTSDRGMAEEVVQETFLALWNRAETFDPASGLAGGVAAHHRPQPDRRPAAGGGPATGAGPAVVGRRRSGGDEADADALDGSWPAASLVAGSGPDALARDEPRRSHELRAALQTRLAAMPEDERTVIVMAYGEDLTQTEIAERLGWPLGTVKTRTRRALAPAARGARQRRRPGIHPLPGAGRRRPGRTS